MDRRLIYRLALSGMGLILMLQTPATRAQTTNSPAKRQRVKIYLAKETKETDREDPKNPGNLRPLARLVNRGAPCAPL